MRPSWDKTWMDIAHIIKQRGTCPRARVGAVLTSPQNVLYATGYNGAPRGLPHCIDVGCQIIDGHCVRVLHAEFNVLGATSATPGCTLYVTQRPCLNCVNMAIQRGIMRIVFDSEYPMAATQDFINDLIKGSNLTLEQIADEPT